MIAIQVSRILGGVANKKLGTTVVTSCMCHRQHATVVILIFPGQFTINLITGAAITNPVRAATLNHKVGDNAVKDKSIIKSLLGKSYKVLNCVRSIFFKEFDFHHSLFGMDFCSGH